MPSGTDFMGCHMPVEQAAWVRAQAKGRRVPYAVVIREALEEYRQRRDKPHHRKGKPPAVWSQAEDRHNKGVG